MDKIKLQGYINIAKKAGYVIIGGDKLYNYNNKLYLVIYSKDASKNTLKVVEKLKQRDIPVITLENLEDIMNIKNCKIIAIKNKNLSDIILDAINN